MPELPIPVPDRPLRVLVVGCPRSGTTLAQSLLASHPDVVGFPELHVFADLRPRRSAARRSGLARLGAARRVRELEQFGLQVSLAVPRPLSWAGWSRRIVRALDQTAAASGAVAWVEKTPRHLYQARALQQLADIHVVHVLRDGPATIASLREVTRRHPDAWGGERSVDQCIARWTRDVAIAAAAVGQQRTYFLSYERLTAEPEAVLGRLFRRLGLDPDVEKIETVMSSRSKVGSLLVLPEEPWKARVAEPIHNDAEKWRATLSPDEQKRVIEATATVPDLSSIFPFL